MLIARPRPQTGRVLVATDFSDPGLAAVRAAVEEAKRIDGELTAVHAIDFSRLDWIDMPLPSSPGGFAIPEQALTAMRYEAERRLTATLAVHGASGSVRVLDGDPAKAIVEVATEIEAQIVVVGTAGRTGLARAAMGSVAEAVVRHAAASVLVVRSATRGERRT